MRGRGRRTAGALAAVAGLGLVALSLGAPAPAEASTLSAHVVSAAQDAAHLQVSIGDSAFAPISTQTLFADDTKLIPGASRSATFRVRNASNDASLLTLALADTHGTSTTLMRSLTIDAVIPGEKPATVSLDSAGSCPTLVKDAPLAGGGELLVTVTLSLLATVTGTQAQGESASFDFIAGLQDAAAAAHSVAPSLCSSTHANPATAPVAPHHPHSLVPPAIQPLLPPLPGTPLADTGSNILPYVLLASTLVGAGTVLLMARRRRDRHTEEKPSEG